MPDVLADRFRRWFDYEQDAHSKTLASLAAVPEELRAKPEYGKAVSLLAHLVAARRMWLFRLGESDYQPQESFPQGMTLDQLKREVDEMHRLWAAYLARLGDAEIVKPFEYTSSDAGRMRNTLDDVLTQLFGHSNYHRGQIAQLVRMIGAQPATTDYIYWCRQPLEQ
jgi:uncharacterized damage-inducible protein DinB